MLANGASAENGSWPELSRGKSVTVSKISDLPKSLQSSVSEHCGEPNDWTFEFFKTDDSNDFALLNCGFVIAWSSVVVKNDNGKPVIVNFAIGDQNTGYSATKNLGITSVDIATGTLSSTFSTDSCGLG